MSEEVTEFQIGDLTGSETETVQAPLATVMSTVTFDSSRIFMDKRVFHLEYVPDHIVHRDIQVSAIRRILADMENGVRPYHILGM